MKSQINKNKKVIASIMLIVLMTSLVACSSDDNKILTEDDVSSQESDVIVTEINDDTEDLVDDSITREDVYSLTEYDYDETDALSTWDESEVHKITFEGDMVIANEGIEVEDSTVYITSGGSYVLSGTLNDGQIVVSAEGDEEVRLILNGVNITSTEDAPISIINADKAIITLAQGTANYITDESIYADTEIDEDATTAAIYSKDDLIINGQGSLIISSESKSGIVSKDRLIVIEGEITVNAQKEALKAKDYIVIEDGILTLTASEDGISATEDEDPEKGYVVIAGGVIDINANQDGIQAETYVLVTGGTLNITTGGSSETVDDSTSAKGIKAAIYLDINGGTIDIDSADDGMHSDDTVAISDGSVVISAADDGIHSDSLLEINGGTIDINESNEGLESKNIYINNGETHIYATDDGINISDSSSDLSKGEALSDAALYITGGYVYVECEGDGLDSNGSMYISGGVTIVNGPTLDNNGGLDCDGECIVEGGYLVVASSSGMAGSPDQTSSQNSVIIGFTDMVEAGTLVHIESSDGNDIVTFRPEKTFQAIVVSSDQLVTGETYNVYVGGSTNKAEVDGLYSADDYSNGTLYDEFTISSRTTTVGVISSGKHMGRKGPGGN